MFLNLNLPTIPMKEERRKVRFLRKHGTHEQVEFSSLHSISWCVFFLSLKVSRWKKQAWKKLIMGERRPRKVLVGLKRMIRLLSPSSPFLYATIAFLGCRTWKSLCCNWPVLCQFFLCQFFQYIRRSLPLLLLSALCGAP